MFVHLRKTLQQPHYRFLAALALSSALHAGIVFFTTAGSGGVPRGKPLFKELQVSIKELATPAEEVVAQQQEQATSGKESASHSPSEAVKPEPKGLIPPPEERYFKLKELDVVPRPISSIMPHFPESVPTAIRRGIVKLEIKLDADGLVTEVTVLGSYPPGYFEDAARDTFVNATFTPGMKSGQKVRSILTLQVHFESPLGF